MKSPTATEYGALPVAGDAAAVNVPSPVLPVPLPSSTDTELEPPLAVARSLRPSPLKSPTATEAGLLPVAGDVVAVNVPSPVLPAPLPSSTDTELEPPLAVARSCRPSPLKSPTATENGLKPVRGDAAAINVPSPMLPVPLPSSTDTELVLTLAVTRSCRPSPLKSPTATDRGLPPIAGDAAAVNVPSPMLPVPLPNNTDTELAPKLAAARSCRPSPLKSPTATETGLLPVAGDAAAVNVPSPTLPVPLPSSTDNELALALAVARSCRPSPLKSPTATDRGVLPVAGDAAAVNVPSPTLPVPLPSSTDTELALALAVARSCRPSPLKSPTATDCGPLPVAGEAAAVKVPSPMLPAPLPSSTDTVAALKLAVARSCRPSPLKSPTATPAGRLPVAGDAAAVNVPSPMPPVPLPNSTDTVPEPVLAITRSCRPSPLNSPTATDCGLLPTTSAGVVKIGAAIAGAAPNSTTTATSTGTTHLPSFAATIRTTRRRRPRQTRRQAQPPHRASTQRASREPPALEARRPLHRATRRDRRRADRVQTSLSPSA